MACTGFFQEVYFWVSEKGMSGLLNVTFEGDADTRPTPARVCLQFREAFLFVLGSFWFPLFGFWCGGAWFQNEDRFFVLLRTISSFFIIYIGCKESKAFLLNTNFKSPYKLFVVIDTGKPPNNLFFLEFGNRTINYWSLKVKLLKKE